MRGFIQRHRYPAPPKLCCISAPDGDHSWDFLSGNLMDGLKGAFTSDEGGSLLGQHETKSFVNDITAFLQAFQSSNGNRQQLIDNFVKLMQDNYGITVTVTQ